MATGDRVAGELSFGHHRLECRLRDRIDASGRGEFYHVSGWVVVRVLDAGTGPQRALRAGTRCCELTPRIRGGVDFVGVPREVGVGDSGAATKGLDTG